MDLILTSPVTREQKSLESLKKKLDRGVALLHSAEKIAKANSDQPLELCYSGGKDSDVILHIAKLAGVNYRAIYKNTTIDPPGTTRHCKDKGVEIIMPKMSFRQLIEKKGLPTRFQRFCCAYLKEYKILDYAVVGIRACESIKRKKRYTEPEQCRVFNKKEKVRQYFPILDWTDDDIYRFIEEENITVHPLYYNNGELDVTRRLGCMCCPLASNKKRREEFLKYPKMLNFYITSLKKYRETHPYTKKNSVLRDVYMELAFTLFANNIEDFKLKFEGSMFEPKVDCKAYMEDYFNITLK